MTDHDETMFQELTRLRKLESTIAEKDARIKLLEEENARLKEEVERLQKDDACKEWSYANELKEKIAALQSQLSREAERE